MSKRVKWFLFSAGAVVLLLGGLIYVAQPPHEQSYLDKLDERWKQEHGEHHVNGKTAAAVDPSDLSDITRAITNHDVSGLAALLTTGRLYMLTDGTQIRVIGDLSPGVTQVRVQSGSAIGKTLYIPTRSISD